ncbi:MAG: TonB-dependent receptor [Gammaproteobacteria bacterium]|nr:TonB-dependent receptor [Gammaproteobacteria bacterium]
MQSVGRDFLSYVSVVALFVASSIVADEGEDISNVDESDELEELVVRAHPLSHDGVSQSVDTLMGEELARAAESSIGETLASLPGVRNASFGPAVGRPVIHGLGGVRVKTMVDRTSTMDLSKLGADHLVTVNPHMANLIEVIKGPSAMVYGSETIGGIVNVDTGRVPKSVPSDGWDGRLDASMSDNAARQAVAGRIDFSADNLILHADFDARQGDDYDIPGCAESSYLHEAEEAEHHHDEEEHHEEDDHHDEEEHDEEHEEICGTLLNSYTDVLSGSFGGSYVDDRGYIGVSISSNVGKFGIPVPHSHGGEEHHDEDEHHDEEEHDDEHEDEHHEHEGPPTSLLDFEQQRLDFDFLRQDVNDSIQQLQVRLGISEYQHEELDEPGGHAETSFFNDEYELRVDATLNRANTSVVGVHLSGRDYQVMTEEDPVLPVTESRLGVSWLHERPLGSTTLELGTRVEAKKVDSDEFGGRNFSDYALSLGLLTDQTRDWTFKVEMSQSSRAPSLEELASRGFHLATNAVEIGNPELGNESQTGFTASATRQTGNLELGLTAYHRRFTDFIYIANSGEFDHGAPVFTYLHRDATFTGFDGTALYHHSLDGAGELDLRLSYDALAITVGRSSETRLPQIPPERITVGLDLYQNALFASLEMSHNAAVSNTAMFEHPTDSWYDLSTRIEYTFAGLGDATDVTLYLKGKNLTDEEQRNHVSIIKDRVPLPGRMLEVGFRLSI